MSVVLACAGPSPNDERRLSHVKLFHDRGCPPEAKV